MCIRDSKYFDIIEELKDINVSDEDIFEQQPGFAIISFAGLDKNNVLLHVNLAHEVGHFIDDIFDISKTNLRKKENMIEIWSSCKPDEKQIVELAEQRAKTELQRLPDLFRKQILSQLEHNEINSMIHRWIREFTADLIALRLIGPAFFFALAYLGNSIMSIDEMADHYPSQGMRLKKLISEMKSRDAKLNYVKFFKSEVKGESKIDTTLKKNIAEIINSWEILIKESEKRKLKESKKEEDIKSQRIDIVNSAIKNYMKTVIRKIREKMPAEKSFKLEKNIFHWVRLLENDTPPTQDIRTSKSYPAPIDMRAILNAGWLHWLNSTKTSIVQHNEYQAKSFYDLLIHISKLVLFGIEFSNMYQTYLKKKLKEGDKFSSNDRKNNIGIHEGQVAEKSEFCGVLPCQRIRDYYKKEDLDKALGVSPLFEYDQFRGASIDIRLGNKFIVFKQSKFRGLDPRDKSELEKSIKKYQDITTIEYGKEFILHPREFVLGSSLEYLCFPKDISGYVIGRSSWGRLGLVIATATQVSPGFKGVITLELSNLGVVPIYLYPGLRIAQLVLHKLAGAVQKEEISRYQCSTEPQFSKIHYDEELNYIIPQKEI